MGHTAVMKAGEVQRISAGTGIAHSEFNNSPTEAVHFLQIWLLPSRKGVKPDYAQQSFADSPSNALTLACSPDGKINPSKSIKMLSFSSANSPPREKSTIQSAEQHGAWIQLIEGDIDLNGNEALARRWGASLKMKRSFSFRPAKSAHFLLFDLN